MINKLELERLKELKPYTKPCQGNTNFELLCGLALIVIGMLIDEEIKIKERLRRW